MFSKNLQIFLTFIPAIKYHKLRAGNNSRSPINDRREKTCDRCKILLADHRDRQKYSCATLVFSHLSKNNKTFLSKVVIIITYYISIHFPSGDYTSRAKKSCSNTLIGVSDKE